METEKEVVEILRESISPKPVTLITYSLKTLNHSQKTLFGYALKGRSGKTGYLHLLKGETIGRNSILIPTGHVSEAKEFFSTWKVQYKSRRLIQL